VPRKRDREGKERERERKSEKVSEPVGQSITGIDLGGKCSHDQPT